MSKNRKHLTFAEVLYRPALELKAAYVYAGCATWIVVAGGITSFELTVPSAMAGGLLAVGVKRALSAYPLMQQQFKLFINRLKFIHIDELRRINKYVSNSNINNFHHFDDRNIFIGEGFQWGPEHSQRTYQILDMTHSFTELELPYITRPFAKKYYKESMKLGGSPWIHGLGESLPLLVHEEAFFGHTFLTGQVGSGKTTALQMLGIGFLHLGHCIVVIDPKGDKSLKNGLRDECKKLGLEDNFFEFNPSKASESYSIDILKNFATSAEVPTRIASLLRSSKSSADSFIDFGWQTISQITEGMIYSGEAPRLTEIYRYMRTGKNELLRKCLATFFKAKFGKNWEVEKLPDMTEGFDSDLQGMLSYYSRKIESHEKIAAVDDVVQFITHNQEHAQKMLASVFPLFKVLCARPLDKLLSPNRHDSTEKIIDIKRFTQNGGVLYCSLNSMSDPKTAGQLAKLILADIAACLGDRYNYGDGNERRVSILVDEVHAAVAGNDALINNLAQGRAAKAQFVLASQTIPDLVAMTDEATANRYLGLCNNFFSMKVTDMQTQEYVSKQFNKTSIKDTGVSYAVQTGTGMGLTEFTGGYKETITSSREDMFPPTLLGDLPKLQYMARLANGQKIKGKLPVISRN